MAGSTITRAQLRESVYREVGLSRNESAELLEAVLRQVSDALARGESVKISSFGSFPCAARSRESGATRKPARKSPYCPARYWFFARPRS